MARSQISNYSQTSRRRPESTGARSNLSRAIPQSPATLSGQPRYYFAYGSNLWHKQMYVRCPHARPVGIGVLPHFKWIVSTRGFANVLMSHPDDVWGMVWALSPADEAVLDRYEGVAYRSYDKYDLAVTLADSGEERICLVYVDPVKDEGRPWGEFIDRINAGLHDSHLPEEYVMKYIRPLVPPPPPPVVGIPRAGAGDGGPRCYFAYGPDMCTKRLVSTAPGARVLDTGLLPRFRWVVSARGRPNLVPSQYEIVYGVVSNISRKDERLLDEAYGVARGQCEKVWQDVEIENGRGTVPCLVYLDPVTREGGVSDGLIEEMQQALWDAKLPQQWVEDTIRPLLFGPD